jgi:phage portal protein BeeE
MWRLNPFKRIKALEQALQNELNRSLYVSSLFKGMPIAFNDNPENLLDIGYMDNPDVYSIISYVAKNAAAIPLRLYDADGKVIEKHEIVDLLEQPNPDMSMTDIIEAFYIYKLSIGNGYLYKPTLDSGQNKGKTKEIHIMPSASVQAIAGTWLEPIQGYKILEGLQWNELPKEEVYHGKFFNPKFSNGSWVYGLSPVKIAVELVRTQNYGYSSLEKAYENGSPPYLISTKVEDGLNEEQQANLEETYKKKYGGAANTKILEVNKQGMRTLANVLGGVPSVLLNDMENSTYSNYRESRKVFYQNVIFPNNNSLQKGLTNWLLKPYPGMSLKFDYSDVEELQESIKEKTESLKNIIDLTGNERRAILGYDDFPGYDQIIGQTARQIDSDVIKYLKSKKL